MPIERESFTGTEIRAGLMVFISGIVLLMFIAAILKFRPQAGEKMFYIPMTDIGGLDRSADVRFGGMVVGRVSKIEPDPKNRAQMLVTAKVAEDTPVNGGSRAFIGQVSLTTEKHLEITTGTSDAPLLKDGDFVSTIPPIGPFGDLSGLTNSVQGLIADVQVLLGVSDGKGARTLDTADTRTIAEIFAQLDGIMADLRVVLGVIDEKGNVIPAEERRTVNDLMTGLDSAVSDGKLLIEDVRGVLAENRQQINDLLASAEEVASSADHLVDNMDDLVTDNRENIDALIENTRQAVSSVNDMMADVKNLVITLNSTLERNGPEFDELIVTLNNTLRNLEELTRTLADQPQSLIRGREPVGRQ
jgi:phospholipid/cholesterol/gamma-HCH transport system substrate-binding protein